MKRRELFCLPAVAALATAPMLPPVDVDCPCCEGTGQEVTRGQLQFEIDCWACDGKGLLPPWQAKATKEYFALLESGGIDVVPTAIEEYLRKLESGGIDLVPYSGNVEVEHRRGA